MMTIGVGRSHRKWSDGNIQLGTFKKCFPSSGGTGLLTCWVDVAVLVAGPGSAGDLSVARDVQVVNKLLSYIQK